jgi:hypothetical protein
MYGIHTAPRLPDIFKIPIKFIHPNNQATHVLQVHRLNYGDVLRIKKGSSGISPWERVKDNHLEKKYKVMAEKKSRSALLF